MHKSIQNTNGRPRAPGSNSSSVPVCVALGHSGSSLVNWGAKEGGGWRCSPWSPSVQTPCGCLQPREHFLAGKRGCPELPSQAANEYILSCAHIWKQFLDDPRHLCCWAQLKQRSAAVESGKRKKPCVRSLTKVHFNIWKSPMPLMSGDVPVALGHSTDKILIKIEWELSSLLLPRGWRPLPFPAGSFWLEAGEECKFQSFVPTFIVIFLSGLLKWGLLMAAFRILCEVELGNIGQVLWRGKCFTSSFSAKQPFTDVPLLSSSGVLIGAFGSDWVVDLVTCKLEAQSIYS